MVVTLGSVLPGLKNSLSLSQPRLRQGLSVRRGRPLSPPSCMPGWFQPRLLVGWGAVPLAQPVRARVRVSRARGLAWVAMVGSVSPLSALAQRQKVAGLAGSARRHFLIIWGADDTPLGGISGEALAFCCLFWPLRG